MVSKFANVYLQLWPLNKQFDNIEHDFLLEQYMLLPIGQFYYHKHFDNYAYSVKTPKLFMFLQFMHM